MNEFFDFVCENCLNEKYNFLKKYPHLKTNSKFDSKCNFFSIQLTNI